MTKEDLEARKNKYFYMQEGALFIKPELQNEWIEYVDNHMNDKIDDHIINVSIRLLKKLSSNISYNIITNTLLEIETSTELITYIISLIVKFSPRGEEFKEYWCNLNSEYQIININNSYKQK